MSNLQLRVITASVLLSLTALAFYFGAIGFFILIGLVCLAMLYESQDLLSIKRNWNGNLVFIGALLAFTTFILFKLGFRNWILYSLCFPILFFPLSLYEDNSIAFKQLNSIVFQYVYIILPILAILDFSIINVNSELQIHIALLACFLCCIWANDIFAYFVGRRFGKHLLFPIHSPKKTWEGFVGGVIASLIVAVLFFSFSELQYHTFGIWFIVVVIGNIGDLFESLMKRSAGLKDSSGLLPGHGGFLDRFDSIILSAPWIWLYFAFISEF